MQDSWDSRVFVVTEVPNDNGAPYTVKLFAESNPAVVKRVSRDSLRHCKYANNGQLSDDPLSDSDEELVVAVDETSRVLDTERTGLTEERTLVNVSVPVLRKSTRTTAGKHSNSFNEPRSVLATNNPITVLDNRTALILLLVAPVYIILFIFILFLYK